ncbi:MAG: hypothetical protein ACSHYF_04770 [Verrucomicrobiaceae bacterium]
MGVIAFGQLVTIGTAMVLRQQKVAEPEVITKVVPQYITVEKEVRVEAPANVGSSLTQAEIEAVIFSKRDRNVSPEVLESAPAIADPVVERLVEDAKAARIAGDYIKAMMKLEEAQLKEPEDANILYEIASNYEAMGVYDSASDYYLKVYQLGPLDGGSLWVKASAKITKGVVMESEGLAVLGALRKMEPEITASGERRGVILSITADVSKEFDPQLLQPKVHFFEEDEGNLRKSLATDLVGSEWVSKPYNFDDGEEMVEVWYEVPFRDAGENLIFGERKFHGFVAELYYDGKLLDIRADPRTLVRQMQNQRATSGSWDPDIDPLLEALENQSVGGSLLPRLEFEEDEPEGDQSGVLEFE